MMMLTQQLFGVEEVLMSKARCMDHGEMGTVARLGDYEGSDVEAKLGCKGSSDSVATEESCGGRVEMTSLPRDAMAVVVDQRGITTCPMLMLHEQEGPLTCWGEVTSKGN